MKYNFKSLQKNGFTLAEVLITLVIIGIIASMTIPTMMANSRRTEIETKIKQTYSILNNALSRAVVDNGPVYTWDETAIEFTDDKYYIFFKNYLEPYLIFAKPLEQTTYKKYGYKKTIKRDYSEDYDMDEEQWLATLNNGAILFRMQYGHGYFKDLEDKDSIMAYSSVAYHIDVNGLKGPNQLGRDIFSYVLHIAIDNPKFQMNGLYEDGKISSSDIGTYWKDKKIQKSRSDILSSCKTKTPLSCGALIQINGWKVPNDYPLKI